MNTSGFPSAPDKQATVVPELPGMDNEGAKKKVEETLGNLGTKLKDAMGNQQ